MTDSVFSVRVFDCRIGRSCFVVASVLFAGLSFWLLRQPLLWLLGVVADDAFYYLQVARNIASTGFSSFDGTNPTNGYHPGWMVLMVIGAELTTDRLTLLQYCLGVSLLFHWLTALLLVDIVRRFVDLNWGLICGAVWMLFPVPLVLVLQGVELPLSVFCLTLVIDVYLSWIDPSFDSKARLPLPLKGAFILGLALGLLVLARTDAVIYAGVLLLLIIFMVLRGVSLLSALSVLLRTVGPIIAGFCLAITPWLVYSYSQVGTLLQDSGVMKVLWTTEETSFIEACKWVVRIWFQRPIALMISNLATLRLAFVGIVLLFCFAVVRLLREGKRGGLFRCTLWLAGGGIAGSLAVGLCLSDVQVWYSGHAFLIFFLLFVSWGLCALRRLDRWSLRLDSRVGGGLFVAVLAIFGRFWLFPPVLYPWQRDVYTSQAAFEKLVPVNETIGCFNAGIPAFFSNRRIVNLDGLVNHTAIAYWKSRQFDRFLKDQHIGYIMDEVSALQRGEQYAANKINLEPLASAPFTGWFPPERWLWRVR